MVSADLIFLHGRHTARCAARVDKQFDGYCTLQFMTRGEIELFYGDRRYHLKGPWFWTAFPGPHIRFHLAPPCPWWEHRYVAFQGPLANQWIASGLFHLKPQAAPRSLRHVQSFDELLGLIQRHDRWGRLRAINALERLLLELAEARFHAPPSFPWLDGVFEELQKPIRSTDYPRLARQFGMALSTLRRRFQMATGVALHSYTLQSRLARARELLSNTNLPIKNIAEQLGYQDVYFFSRQFCKFSGLPPARFRKSRDLV